MNINKDLLLDVVHPIGSIYMSTSSTSPATLFGGSWTRIQDRFLLAAGSTYTAGKTGGSATHTHKYGIQFANYWGVVSTDGLSAVHYDSNNSTTVKGNSKNSTGTFMINSGAANSYTQRTSVDIRRTNDANTSYTSTLPPYLVVYVWKRTA